MKYIGKRYFWFVGERGKSQRLQQLLNAAKSRAAASVTAASNHGGRSMVMARMYVYTISIYIYIYIYIHIYIPHIYIYIYIYIYIPLI